MSHFLQLLLLLSLIVAAAKVAGALARRVGQPAVFGEILAGLVLGPNSIFVPAFFIGIGLQANGRELGSSAMFAIVLVLVAIVTKAAGCGIFARLSGFTTKESVRVGASMISRGEVGLIVAGYGLANGLIRREVFSASVIMVLATTMVTPPLLRLLFPHRPGGGQIVVEETVAGPPGSSRGLLSM